VGDDALIAEMLAAMSHQAAFSRRSDETIDLALAARRSAVRSGAPSLHAESFALEAQGLALRGDGRGCISALQRAERAFLAATAEIRHLGFSTSTTRIYRPSLPRHSATSDDPATRSVSHGAPCACQTVTSVVDCSTRHFWRQS
jgi:hypothetical protein